MNIKTKEILYLGYRQGWKVYVNGKKFPLQRNKWFSELNEQRAIEDAVLWAQHEAIQCREDHSSDLKPFCNVGVK